MTTLAEKVAEFDAAVPDWQVSSELNTPDGEEYGYVWVPLRCEIIRDALLANGAWLEIKHARDNANLDQSVRNAAETLIDAITLQERIDLTDDGYRQEVMDTVDILTAAELLSEVIADQVINEYGRRPLSWAEANNIKVDARAVGIARGGKA